MGRKLRLLLAHATRGVHREVVSEGSVIRIGRYRPKSVRRVEIPKDNGKTRKTGNKHRSGQTNPVGDVSSPNAPF